MAKRNSTVVNHGCDRCFKYGGHRVISKNGNVHFHCFNCKFDTEYDGFTAKRIIRY